MKRLIIIEHMDPISRGGKHNIFNIVICCKKCNGSKGDMPFIDWVKTLEGDHRLRAIRAYVNNIK